MKGLTFHRPWPYSMTDLGKKIENRNWPLPQRLMGAWIAMHAGRVWSSPGANFIADHVPMTPALHSVLYDRALHDPPQIVATVRFTHQVQTLEQAERWQRGQGKWFFGDYGWCAGEIIKLEKPIEIMGHQGFWNVPGPIFQMLKAAGALPPR